MTIRTGLVAALLFVTGCAMDVAVDPEGYRCDPGQVCPEGFACREGVCRRSVALPDGGDPACAGVVCDAVPAPLCVTGGTLRTFAGACEAGQCRYLPTDTACQLGCLAGECRDPCAGVTCVAPPQPACVDASTLRTFARVGTCEAGTGACTYTPTTTVCTNGCENGRCKGVDLCQLNAVSCDAPPAAVCVGNTRRSYALPGACDPGTALCSYAETDTPCPTGCAGGQCVTASLSFTQVGPRVRFAVNGLDVAPGSSGASALAVGNGGRLARWDGSAWQELTTPAAVDLNRVAFVSSGLAYVVGKSRTAWTVRPAQGQVAGVSPGGPGSANLVGVSGRGENDVLLADDSGGWWRLRGGQWSNGTLPNGPWAVTAAWLDETHRERIAGQCGPGVTRSPCVAYRYLSGATPSWTTQPLVSAASIGALGGGFEMPTTTASTPAEAFLGLSDQGLVRHSTAGFLTGLFFSPVVPSPSLVGAGLRGITAQVTAQATRDVYVLTSSAPSGAGSPGEGGLYRLSSGMGGVTATRALETYFGEEVLSPNDANGVLVAEVRRSAGINNIFRRGVVANEALDLAEDFVGASVDDAGALVLASAYGDVAVRAPGSATFDFRRPSGTWTITALEARRGTGTLLVGRSGTGTAQGVVVRATSAGFATAGTRAAATFNDVCRASDNEGWVVGTGGAISRVTTSGLTTVSSPTTRELKAVDCAPGKAVACGVDGTVLRLAGGTWAAVSPALPTTSRTLTTCRLVGDELLVGGDGVFYRFAQGGWTALPTKTGLTRLLALSPTEVYGVVTASGRSDLLRFDGTAWSPSLLQVPGPLGGGVQTGARVVWAGGLGVIVEGR